MTFKIPSYEHDKQTRLMLVIPGIRNGASSVSVTAPAASFEDQVETLQRAVLHEMARPEDRGLAERGYVFDQHLAHIALIDRQGRLLGAGDELRSPVLRDAPAPRVPEWTNCGDISPRNGTKLFKLGEAEFDSRGFTVPAVDVAAESDVGGSDKVFTLRQGSVFLSSGNWGKALQAIGVKLGAMGGGHVILAPGPDGKTGSPIPLKSEDGIRILSEAAYSYAGIDDIDTEVEVSIGLPDRTDQPRVLGQALGIDTTYYRDGSSLWAIMRSNLSWFNDIDPKENKPFACEPFPEDLIEGMPENIRDRADLASMAAFRDLGVDTAGNPIVWENSYEHGDCESIPDGSSEVPSWTMEWSCECEDECPECGTAIEPTQSRWIGPDDPDLRVLWEDLPERTGPVAETDHDMAP